MIYFHTLGYACYCLITQLPAFVCEHALKRSTNLFYPCIYVFYRRNSKFAEEISWGQGPCDSPPISSQTTTPWKSSRYYIRTWGTQDLPYSLSLKGRYHFFNCMVYLEVMEALRKAKVKHRNKNHHIWSRIYNSLLLAELTVLSSAGWVSSANLGEGRHSHPKPKFLE